MKPFLLEPKAVERVWGGRRLAELRFSAQNSGQPIGESWEIHGTLRVRDGAYAGQTLDEVCRSTGEALLGRWGRRDEGFPLLVKWLDSRDWLSVQVHPDDSLAQELHGQRGKTEAWHFWEVAEPPQGEIIHGFTAGPPADLEQLPPGDWTPHLHRFRPRVGDWLFIPAGTVHALGPGLLVYEVQQSSDLTYRIYDWDRPGLDGQPRELHREQSLRAIRETTEPTPPAPPPDCLGRVQVGCAHFCVEQVEGSRSWSPGGKSVELLTCLGEAAQLRCGGDSWSLSWGDTLVVPASAEPVEWHCPPLESWIRVRLAPCSSGSSRGTQTSSP